MNGRDTCVSRSKSNDGPLATRTNVVVGRTEAGALPMFRKSWNRTATWPSRLTATEALSAAGSPLGLTSVGAVHEPVRPSGSPDVEMTTWSFAPPLNRASCQTTYRRPVLGSMAGSGRMSPVRNWLLGLRGSTTPPRPACSAAVSMSPIRCGWLHVTPWSSENS